MTGKYTNPLKYHAVRFYRALIRRRLARLAKWEPVGDAKEGYSVVIGCNAPLAAMLGANLQMLGRQDLTHLDRIYVVFDRPAEEIPFPVEQKMRERHPKLPLTFIFYSPTEARELREIGVPWGYSWFSWYKGLSVCRSRYALLHDFDAMLIRPDVVEERYRATAAASAQWCGIRYYDGNGISPSDELCTTFEMMLEVPFLRETFKPIDGFNHVTRLGEKTVDFDTFLYCQTRAGRKLTVPIEAPAMVHPSQVIHQFTELTHRRNYISPCHNNLFFIPYFLYLAGEGEQMEQTRAALQGRSEKVIPFFGRQMDMRRLTDEHTAWIRKQTQTLESVLAGSIRPEVEQYLQAIEAVPAK